MAPDTAAAQQGAANLKIKVHIENSYTDGHESETDVEVDPPESGSDEDIEEWWENVVFQETGDGHYSDTYDATGERLGSCYTATVVEAPGWPKLRGEKWEWLD